MEIHRKNICSSLYIISVAYSAVHVNSTCFLHLSKQNLFDTLHKPLLSSQVLEDYNSGTIQGHNHPPKTEQASPRESCQVFILDEFLKQRFHYSYLWKIALPFSLYFIIYPINILLEWTLQYNFYYMLLPYECDDQAVCPEVDINVDGIRLTVSTIFNLSQLLHSSLTVIGKL